MITKEITYKKAFEFKKEALLKKQRNRELILSAAYTTNPKLTEIDNKLAELGANLAITALSGDTKKITTLKVLSQDLTNEKNAILKKCEVPEITYDCAVCNDTGYVGGRVCECVKKLANSIMLSEFTKQMPLDDCKFENFDLNYYSDKNANRRMTSILNLCKDYVKNFNPHTSPNLLFVGRAGLGKTHLTLAIVSGVIEKGFTPIYGPCENLFSLIEKEKFTGENKGSYEAMINCDLLVLDDLGAEISTSISKATLYNLINTRMLSKKPTIINTNLEIDEIAEKYSARVTSRLIGNYISKEFLGSDIRQQKILGK